MKKSLLGLISVFALLFSLTACGGSDEAAVPEEDKQELVQDQELEAQAKGGFDSDIQLPIGETYRLSSPTKRPCGVVHSTARSHPATARIASIQSRAPAAPLRTGNNPNRLKNGYRSNSSAAIPPNTGTSPNHSRFGLS